MSSEDFKSFCRALIPSGVGSIPTRSRHLPRAGAGAAPVALALSVSLLAATASAATGPEAEARFRPSPRGALIRSTVLPGWGQLYNRSYLKALLFSAGRIYLGYRVIDEHRLADALEREALASEDPGERGRKWREHNRALARRDDFIWYSAYALVFTMAEAYVDAALMEFDEEFDEIEEAAGGDGRSRTVRLGVRHRF